MRLLWLLALLVVSAMTVTGCEVIGGIFKAGVWTGIVGFVVLLAIVLGVVKLVTGARA